MGYTKNFGGRFDKRKQLLSKQGRETNFKIPNLNKKILEWHAKITQFLNDFKTKTKWLTMISNFDF